MSPESSDSTTRFSSRVDAYVKYCPGYPPAVYDLFRAEMKLTPASVVADVGSGTGISAEPLLRAGNVVHCVEPNDAMRAAAERLLGKYPGFRSVKGTGEATTLPDGAADLVVCAQAFHWLDHARAAAEFRRVARPGGFVAILWNERLRESSSFLMVYDDLLIRYGTDYLKVAHEKSPMTVVPFEKHFGVPFRKASFPNAQRMDLAGLRGRVASSSYTPAPGQPHYDALQAGLDALYAEHANDGLVTFEYETQVFYARLD